MQDTKNTNNKKNQIIKVTTGDYIIFAVLLFMFLFFLADILFLFFHGLSYHLEGNEYGAAWTWCWCIMGSPALLLFGIPSFIIGRRIIKYRKFLKNPPETENEEQEDVNINKEKEVVIEQNAESLINVENEELPINGHIETDDFTNMRIIQCNNALFQKTSISKIVEWILIIALSYFFLSIIVCIIIGVKALIRYHNAGMMDIGTVIGISCTYGIPALLIFGLPLFFVLRSKIKYHKRMSNIYAHKSIKKVADWCVEENRIWATVKDIDYIDYKYAKDVFWVVCDIVKEEEQAIYRYASYKVKEDLFGKIEPGQEIAIYFNPQKPKEYFVNIDEVR